MKPFPLFLAASIAANALLLTLLCFGPSSAKTFPFLSNKNPGTSASTTSAATVDAQKINLAETLASHNPDLLRDQLRALGLPEEVVRSMVRSLLWSPYYERYRALVALHKGDTSDLMRGGSYYSGFTKEERTELRTLSRGINQQVFSLLGSNSIEPELDTLRYGYLPQDKADQIRLINRDYAEMRSDLAQEISRFRVASDDQKLKLLEQERRKDIEALLSPSELSEYDMRHSSTASLLRNRLANVNVSDGEFYALFDLLKPVYDISANPGLPSTGPRPNERLSPEQISQLTAQRDARAQADEKVRALLGDERFAEYKRAGDFDYRTLQAAATRFSLPQPTIEQVYNLRNTVSTETQQIANNANLEAEQKKAALATLAEQTRTQVRTALGQEIGDAYLKTNMRWLDRVASGYTVTFSPTSNSSSFKPVAPKTRTVTTTPSVQK
jgi:hypothetical protein